MCSEEVVQAGFADDFACDWFFLSANILVPVIVKNANGNCHTAYIALYLFRDVFSEKKKLLHKIRNGNDLTAKRRFLKKLARIIGDPR